MNNIKEIVSNFTFEGEFEKCEPYGFGHINDTYAIYFKNGPYTRYILQKINKTVFKTPEQLMSNIEGVTSFLKSKIIQNKGDYTRETLNLISTKDGKCFFIDSDSNYWRSYIFIENAKTYQIVENPEHLYQSGKAFGAFQKHLADYPAETLYDTISSFHDTAKRFETFKGIIAEDKLNLVHNVMEEITFILNRADEMSILTDMLENKQLPLRVTHNDTKFNNVMIDDNTGKAVCVVDLDTVMPGLSLYDFGDSIRSGTNPAEEDEQDLSLVTMDINLYEKYTKGYLEEATSFLTENEIKMLPFSAKLMTLECGMRFLGDYLSGDVYFKVHRKDHNLDRARTQFKMVSDMEKIMDQMTQIVTKYV